MLRFLNILSCATALIIPNLAAAQQPVVVELFSNTLCSADKPLQDRIKEIAASYPTAIILNCRTKSGDQDARSRYELDFCTERMFQFTGKILMTSLNNPGVMINGRYDASAANVTPAVDMGLATDTIHSISITKQNDMLHIVIPDGLSPDTIPYIFTYLSSHEVTYNPASPKIAEDQNLPQSKPFEGAPQPIQDFYFRPIVAAEKLAGWTGREKNLSYKIPVTDPFQQTPHAEGYIVILTDSDGAIHAAGELKATDPE